MASNVYIKTKIYSKIDDASCVKDLEPILSSLPVDSLKDLIKAYIKTLNVTATNSLFYTSFPMIDILNIDVVQYILSFNVSNEINSVNKSFKYLSTQNEHILLNQILCNKNATSSLVNKNQLKYLKFKNHQQQISKAIVKTEKHLKYLQTKQQEIRQKIHNVSTESYNALKQMKAKQDSNTNYNDYFCPEKSIKHIEGFNNTFNVKLDDAAECDEEILDEILSFKCKSGDKILIHNGTYYTNAIEFENMDLQIIGVGDNVIMPEVDSYFSLNKNCNIYIENIKFDATGGRSYYPSESKIKIQKNSSLWLNKCNFDYCTNHIISVMNGCNCYVRNCRFIGKYTGAGSVLTISPWAKSVNIMNCIFGGCGHVKMDCKTYKKGQVSCIQIQDGNESEDVCWNSLSNDDLVKLRCIKNTFINNFGCTVAKKYRKWNDDEAEWYMTDGIEHYQEYLKHTTWFDQYKQSNYLLKDNVLKGANGLDRDDVVNDANKLYSHQL